MQPNVGTIDRIARAALGVVLLLAPFVGDVALFQSGLATAISVIVGLVMLGTAATRLCPLYSLLGIKTCRSA
jgi:hypothetical protein